jgi:molybdopterin-containing oxidoreductase family membrane subunit
MTVTTDIKELFLTYRIFWTIVIVSVIGMAISGLAILNLVNQGLVTTGMTDFVPMGIWLVFYIFFTGLSAGSFIMSTLAYVFNIERFKPIGRRAVALALILLVNAPIFLAFDLGRPERDQSGF